MLPEAEVHGIGATLETGFTLTLQSESYSGATGANTMTEAVTNDRPTVASRPRSKKPATVSASALAVHLDCSRAYVGKLEAEGVIQRQGDGFPLDQSRVAYLRFLRREHRRSPRTEADAITSRPRPNCCRSREEEAHLGAA